MGAAPDDGRAASLPKPFATEAWPVDNDRLLEEVEKIVGAQLAAIGSPGCYAGLLPRISSRVAFLSPYEFLVVAYYDRTPETRAALLSAYRDDPHLALRRLSPIWPSSRAELLVEIPALFDLDTNQIFVNLGALRPERALRVLVHEFWHALANVDIVARADGRLSRTTGFWTAIHSVDGSGWRSLEERLEGGVPTYLMNEALAIDMETRATGGEHPDLRADLVEALDTLEQLYATAGRQRVVQLYLESRSDELKVIAYRAAHAGGG